MTASLPNPDGRDCKAAIGSEDESAVNEDYPGWDYVSCGCCGGIEWGGEYPRECRRCGGSGSLWLTPSGTRLALYPGGPFAGVADEGDRKEAGRVSKQPNGQAALGRAREQFDAAVPADAGLGLDLREIAKRDYLRLLATDTRLREVQATLAVESEEVERLAQLLVDLRDEVIHTATNSTDRLARERLLAAVERAS